MRTPFLVVHTPSNLAEAVEALAAEPNSRPIAGSLSLVPQLHRRQVHPAALVDLSCVAELAELTIDGPRLRAGATVTLATVRRAATDAGPFSVVAEALRSVGYHHVRSRSTVGGSLCHAAAAGQVPLLAVGLAAELSVLSPAGERDIAAEEFFVDDCRTVLEAGNLLTGATFRCEPGLAYGFHQPLRSAGVSAIVGLPTGSADSAVVAVAGVLPRPVRMPGVAALLDHGDLPPVADLAAAVSTQAAGAASEHAIQLAAVAVRRAATQTGRKAR